MIEHESEFEFDDPGLKSAVRRTTGREAAPPQLRARVQSLLAAEGVAIAGQVDHGRSNGQLKITDSAAQTSTSSPARSRGFRLDRSSWRVVAAAACVLLALGFMFYEIHQTFFPSSPYVAGGGGAVTAVPASLVLDMTRTHDNCSKLPDHHKIPGNDPLALKEKLSAGASVTASTISLGADWTFKGAGVCKVGDKDAAHLLWVRGDEYVSLFSLAAPEDCGYGAQEYKDIYEKHLVTGFRQGNALYCLVGSSTTRPITDKNELDPFLAKVRSSLAAATAMAPRNP